MATAARREARTGSSWLAVEASAFLEGQLGVIACRPFHHGELLYTVRGPVSPRRTCYSFQCGPQEHIDPCEQDGSPTFGHFTNHSCEPNAYICIVVEGRRRVVQVRARRSIPRGDEITLDYAAMEYELASPVECQCGSTQCRGQIVGFRDLPRADKLRRYAEGLAPQYLFDLDEADRSFPAPALGAARAR